MCRGAGELACLVWVHCPGVCCPVGVRVRAAGVPAGLGGRWLIVDWLRMMRLVVCGSEQCIGAEVLVACWFCWAWLVERVRYIHSTYWCQMAEVRCLH